MMRGLKIGVVGLMVMLLVGLGAASALAAEEPVYGGVMKIAIAGDPPSLDMHRETTFTATGSSSRSSAASRSVARCCTLTMPATGSISSTRPATAISARTPTER